MKATVCRLAAPIDNRPNLRTPACTMRLTPSTRPRRRRQLPCVESLFGDCLMNPIASVGAFAVDRAAVAAVHPAPLVAIFLNERA